MNLLKRQSLFLFLILLFFSTIIHAAQTCTTNQIAAVDFNGISGSSDNNVVAAGKNGEVYIYDGANWTTNPVTIPGNPGEDLEDVAVINATSSVVVGKNGTVLLQDSGTWSTLSTPNGEDLKAVWAYSTSDFYVFGKKGTVYHYNGAWSDLSGAAATGNNDDFEDAWGNGTYLYGLTKAGELFQLTLGGSWTTINTCAAAANKDLKSLWGDAAGNLYLAGKDGDVFYYELSSGNCTQLSTSASEDLEGIYGSAATGEIYAVGKKGTVFYGTASGATTTLTETTVGSEDFKAVWVSSVGNAYYAAKKGYTSTCTYIVTPPTATCSTITIASNEDLNGISGSSDNNVVAAGKNGEVYIYDGTNWSMNPIIIPGNPDEDLEDVSAINDTSSVVVGKNGTVLLQDNSTWSTLTTPNGEDLKAVWAYSTTEIYVFGKKGTIYHYDATTTTWSDLSGAAATGNNDDFEDAWGNGTYLYGLTKAGELFQLTLGGSWTTINTCAAAANKDLKSLWGDAAGNLYLAGKGGDIFFYDASTGNCTQQPTSASEDLEGIYGSTVTGEIYAVGKKGVTIYFNGTTWTETTVSSEDLKAVWVSITGLPYYAGKGGTLTICTQVSTLHHIEIIHDGLAITCSPEPITVKVCANMDCSTLATTAVAVNLSPTTASSSAITWFDSDSKTITESVDLTLQQTIVGNLTLGTVSTSPNTNNPVICKNAAGAVISCTINFVDSGFIFINETDGNTILPTQLSGKDSNIGYNAKTVSLQAVKASDSDPTQCLPAFQNKTLNIDFAAECNNPSSCVAGQLFNLTSGAVSGNLTATTNDNGTAASSSYDTRSIAFDANGKSNIIFNYPESGLIELHARHNILLPDGITQSGNYMSGSTSFVVRPLALALSNLSYAADASGSAFKKAGEDFITTLSAVRWQATDDIDNDGIADTGANLTDNATTQNFGNENITPVIPSNITTSHTVTLVPNTGILTNSTDSPNFTNGVGTKTYNWSEVGIFNLTTTLTNYLASGDNVIGNAQNIGRFVPDHFDTILISGCIGASNFTYSGQAFSVSATAKNVTGATTQNYENSFAYSPTLSDAGVSPIINFTNNTIPAANFSNGIGTRNDVTYTFPTKETVPTTITLRARDADTPTAIGSTEDSTEIRSGRTRIENSFSSELVDMPITAQVEYYNTNGFEINAADTCSAVDVTLTDIGTDPITINQTCIWDDAGNSIAATDFTCAADASKPQFSEPASNGNFNINLKAPGENNTGDIGVTLISSTWLKYDWDGDGVNDNDPTGIASFGLYRGDDRIIYWREIFE